MSDKTLDKDEMDNLNESWKKHGSFGGRGGPPLTAIRVGIIGCGQLGTLVLTRLLEIREHLPPIDIYVSTRQPHLLRSF